MQTSHSSKEIHLVSRPKGGPRSSDFAVVVAAVPDLGPGEVLVRNRFLSVDPYMRGRMRDAASYVPPFELGAVMTGMAVGEVVASQSPDFAAGDFVVHDLGWREYALGPASSFRRVPAGEVPLSAWLGVLGTVGLTAWVGMLEIAALKPGDVVFVSGAAGAVGSLAGQIARLRGAARVVGSVGSEAKVRYVCDELGFDAAFNYHEGPAADLLAAA
ncbi:MAG TPA: NADP-dependent oxidoreductase, partial [Thermoleophilia bacterium]|nr:NADP-dependent oxidoreductase [Thermoleophilia bacterium]